MNPKRFWRAAVAAVLALALLCAFPAMAQATGADSPAASAPASSAASAPASSATPGGQSEVEIIEDEPAPQAAAVTSGLSVRAVVILVISCLVVAGVTSLVVFWGKSADPAAERRQK